MIDWRLIDGVWKKFNLHRVEDEPPMRGIEYGKPPGGIIRGPNLDRFRRFDRPSDSQIKSLEREDEERFKKEVDPTPAIEEAIEGLKIGKIQISSDVIDEKNKQIKPFGSVQDERGRTQILPQEKVRFIQGKVEAVHESEPRITEKQLIDMAIEGAKKGQNIGRIFG